MAFIKALPSEIVKDIVLAALAYKNDGTEPDNSLMQNPRFEVIWLTMKPLLDDGHSTYLRKVENAKVSVKKRKENNNNKHQSQKSQSEQEQNKKRNHYRGKVIHISKIPDRCTKCGGLIVRSVGDENIYKCVDFNTLWGIAPP